MKPTNKLVYIVDDEAIVSERRCPRFYGQTASTCSPSRLNKTSLILLVETLAPVSFSISRCPDWAAWKSRS